MTLDKLMNKRYVSGVAYKAFSMKRLTRIVITKVSRIGFLTVATVIITPALLFGQFKSQVSSQTPLYPRETQNQESILSLTDPERFSMDHGFSLNMASFGGQALSYGVYSNRLNYMISNKWTLQTNFDIVQSSQAPFANGRGQMSAPFSQRINSLSGQVYYGAKLQYRPLENLEFSISMDNYPRLYRYGPANRYSPFSRYRE